mmetsp:Transcript_33105/g.43601  ORF Transcript_33105/g.43601 Transcript_33105/m.43601 type:complete len:106 (+) Transcript_33105:2528-2845(+)
MDDGETFYHESNCEKTYINFIFSANMLTHQVKLDNRCWYEGAEQQHLTTVTIYDVARSPESVELKQTGAQASFTYNAEMRSVTISDLPFTVYVPGATQGVKTELL